VVFKSQAFGNGLGTYTTSIREPLSHSGFYIALLRIRLYPHTHPGALKFSSSLHTKHVAPLRMLTALAPLVTHPFIVFLPFSPPHLSSTKLPCCTTPPRRVQTAGAQARQLVCFSVSLPSARERWGALVSSNPRYSRAPRDTANAFLGRRGHAFSVHQAPAKRPDRTYIVFRRLYQWRRAEAWGVCQLIPFCLTFYHPHSRPGMGRWRCGGAEPATRRIRQTRCVIFGVG
jgi:hypothetical protein